MIIITMSPTSHHPLHHWGNYYDLDKNHSIHLRANLVIIFYRNLENHCNLWIRWKELQKLLVMSY